MTKLTENGADIAELIHDLDLGAMCAKPEHAIDFQKGIPIYSAEQVSAATRHDLMIEWGDVLSDGAGALVVKNAITDVEAVDAASDVFFDIIKKESAGQGGEGDHFSAAGNNARIWNSAQKLCLADPEVFARYHASPALDAVCKAWLGPGYQMTAQVNLVRPGGAAQEAHRDYHMGFLTADRAAEFPEHVHMLSPALTLQGAIAHCEITIESGSTKLLPHSQRWRSGYVAMRRKDVRALFEERCVQLPLAKGDALFFNPALFHGAGANVSEDIQRLGNLIQVSSAFGRSLEALDRTAMVKALYPVLLGSSLTGNTLEATISAAAEGYSFPTNLDSDPPIDGLAPETQSELMHRMLAAKATVEEFEHALDQQNVRRLP